MKKLLCALLLLGSFSSHAGLIDFEALPGGPADPINTDGFIFDFEASAFGVFVEPDPFPGLSSNGTTRIGAQGGGAAPARLTMFADDNSLFTVLGFDLASLFSSLSGTVVVVGTLADNSTVSQIFNVSGSFTTFSLDASFSDLQRISFAENLTPPNTGAFGQTAGFFVDNIQTAEVPEPGSMLLLILGLAGISVLRRKHS
ncbi:PEP-CTERM sorting domain-containing protein [Endozoicomonas sp. G2_1]|uniref:PEP-CTERM sorting domain-containing protein n=1 Tax=Endozoicomonas sp. G2_1 TaxID=2821091 RepID=UPI001AD97D68|nr:PEP-CTERM sorting domain-containing protein [Endozoicomonas sp. G2_1]MBO9489739.1 PEP-CTERM sorting domain-containing protein [Endozoicomonas sp. G2_1]